MATELSFNRKNLSEITGIPDLYASGTTQLFPIGATFTNWQDREFVYAKSTGACLSGQGAEFTAIGYTAITAFAVAAAASATSVTVPAATHAALTGDELSGGYICIFCGDATNNVMFRGIAGNEAAAANAAFIAYLDAPLSQAVVVTTSSCETYQNPYAALRTSTSTTLPKAGLPAVNVSASGRYFWVQKRGMCWIAPQEAAVGGSRDGIGCFWRHDGSLNGANTTLAVTVAANNTSQYAGHVVEGSQAAIGPLFMLQG